MSDSSPSPRSLDDVLARLARQPDLLPLAGCTDLLVAGALATQPAPPVLDLLTVPDLRGIVVKEDVIAIGATTTFADLGRHDEVRRQLPSLAAAARVVGGWQIQARATVGGNIANASPAGDSLPVWLAFDATVVLAGPDSSRRVPYRDMHVGYRRTALRPGEIIHRVEVPAPRPGTRLFFRKVGARRALAISKVVMAGAFTLEDGVMQRVRLAAGSVAPTPVRLAAVEAFLEGQRPSSDVADEAARLAAAGVAPIDDVRSTSAYRRHVVGRLVRRWVLEVAPGVTT